ncbi:YveK family protein [Ureibacillus manganicus]|uniref:YveK family protein n=1 Tax=Ureibacillus manganicus TaxID=1266064 RepID=UPI0005672C3F|nr:Wzz/FepE/Etk N-terminal domain-containing protein [Ureibacillus manganicus]
MEQRTVTLQEILALLKKRFILIVSLTVLAGLVVGMFSYFWLTPVYQAQTQILVNQKSTPQDAFRWREMIETDIQLINTYNVIIKSPVILERVIEELDLKTTPEKLTSQIIVTSQNQSRVLNVRVQDANPSQAVIIVNTIANVFKKEIPKLLHVDNINILSVAELSANPNPLKPNKTLNVAIGATIGLMVAIFLAFLLEYLDNRVKDEDDVEELLEIPVMGTVGVIVLPRGISKKKRKRKL